MISIIHGLTNVFFYNEKLMPEKTGFVLRMEPQSRRQTLQWRHNGRDGVSNNQPYDCLLIRLFRHRSKQTSKLRVTALCEGNSPETGKFPAQRPVTRKMLPFDDVIMVRFRDISKWWDLNGELSNLPQTCHSVSHFDGDMRMLTSDLTS